VPIAPLEYLRLGVGREGQATRPRKKKFGHII
jgi:hypothetical protein